MLSTARLVCARRSSVSRCLRLSALACRSTSSSSSSAHVPAPSSPSSANAPQITLTPAEANLFDFLVYIQHLYAPTTQLRVAGGWVRDKLRGAESDDIDIVLDNINGKTFANHILAFQRQRRLPQSSVGVVKANSDKSKHLEVATVSIDGHMVDLVHLRAEAYTPDSRIPETTFAKPIEDASRRDITINALFYNLHTHHVEDFTGQGLADLAAGVIRTPLEPFQTFLDDPLRVLRAIRFACAFGYRLDDKLTEAVAQHAEIRDAMARKVSRERIGIEVRKMLSGNDPARALELLASFELLDLVFEDPSREDTESTTSSTPRVPRWTNAIARDALAHVQFLQQSRLALAGHQISFVEATGALLTPLFLGSAVPAVPSSPLAPSRTAPIDEQTVVASALRYLRARDAVVRQLPLDSVVELLKTSVKWPKPAAKRVAFIIEAVAAFPQMSNDAAAAPGDALQLFMWMTRYNSVLAPALSILLTHHASARDSEVDAAAAEQARDATLRAYLDLGAAYAKREADAGKKRRLDGNVIKTHLGADAGPKIARALEVLQVWEMVHPNGSMDDEVAFLQQLAPELDE